MGQELGGTQDLGVIELPELPSDSHLLLSQMLESAIAVGAALQPKTCDKLKAFEGKSKSGKLAKQLLGLSQEAEHIAAINTAIVGATRDSLAN